MNRLINRKYEHGASIARWFAILISVSFFIALRSTLNAQTVDAEVRSYVDKIEKGHAEEAKKALSDFAIKYPNDPGVVYLQGRLAANGIDAAKNYQSIVDNFPKSEWADDALYALYQYYYALGLYKTADIKLQQLKKEYPNSPFATGKQTARMPSQEDEVVKLPSKDIVQAETTKQTPPEVQPPAPEPYTLQVGAYSSMKNAEKQKSFFETLGVNVEVTNKVRGGRSLYLVWAGSFATQDEAKSFGKEIKKKYRVDSIVVEKY